MNTKDYTASHFEWDAIPDLGVGIGFRPNFRASLFQNMSAVDFLEITADHYFTSHKGKLEELALLNRHFTLIPHAINLSLGSAEGLDDFYLEQLAALIEEVNPPYWSEHIAFTKAHGIEIGHLSPVPYSQEAIDIFCKNIEKLRSYIRRPLILENITYAFYVPGLEMTETEFITQILQNAEVGLLLDITNLYTNSVNHQFDYKEFLDKIPSQRITQLHFTGGHWQDGVLIDSHGHPTPPEVWQVMEEVLKRQPVKGIILERDENIPPFAELQAELSKARALLKKHHPSLAPFTQ